LDGQNFPTLATKKDGFEEEVHLMLMKYGTAMKTEKKYLSRNLKKMTTKYF
jgi:hypothetical protein